MPSIREFGDFGKRYLTREIAFAIILILVGLASFGLGRLSVLSDGKQPVRIEYGEQGASPSMVKNGAVVGSKNGSKYHLPWCSGAQRIKEENKVYFDSIEDAKRNGYTAAANCPGLE